MLEGLKKFFARKDEPKPENQRNTENGIDSETLRNSEVEQQEGNNS